jgi:DNA polymerase III subunit chi
MTRVDFYTDAADKGEVACRLAAKAMQQKQRVLIVTSDQALLQRVNVMLWTHPPIGFVPHCFVHDKLATQTPVLLSHSSEDPPHDQVLINLGDERPSTFARFARLLEIVSTDEADKNAARERFRFYRDRGYAMQTHRLGATP